MVNFEYDFRGKSLQENTANYALFWLPVARNYCIYSGYRPSLLWSDSYSFGDICLIVIGKYFTKSGVKASVVTEFLYCAAQILTQSAHYTKSILGVQDHTALQTSNLMISFVPQPSHHRFTVFDRYQKLSVGKAWEWGTRFFDKNGIRLFDVLNN